ncbi:MAG: hypothetical protein ACKV2V_16495 [Blastocatellia bacterium]
MAIHKVRITAHDNSLTIEPDPASVEIAPGDTIAWESDLPGWEVVYQGETMFPNDTTFNADNPSEEIQPVADTPVTDDMTEINDAEAPGETLEINAPGFESLRAIPPKIIHPA